MAEEKEEKGFVIKDRRIFGEEGEKERKQEPERPAHNKEAKTQEEIRASRETREDSNAAHAADQLAAIDFPGFIMSLYTSAALHFGDMADPATGKKEKNLAAAGQMIDIIAMLKAKTKGNLDQNETQLIDSILYDLQMRFVKEK
ncbi:MAG: DUF1844 domain-containing protein [Syntrophales bacterium]|jgi:hypothetical protein|nr:DUF1844 domain-containing protein [Syntrophales bacterium]MDY0043480.1 DUF1844 domain-containing protein [Syntrophales bacterium]